MKELFIATKKDVGQRVDIYLSSRISLSRSVLKNYINAGSVTVNSMNIKPSFKVRANDEIEISHPEDKAPFLVPELLPIEIVYQDKYLIVLNKPPGMVMYPAHGHQDGTLMNAVAHFAERLSTIGAPLRPGVVHRIDKDTSGLVVVALSDEAYYGFVEQFKERLVKRRYICLVFGNLKEERGKIELPIGRSRVHRKKMTTKGRSVKPAKTLWKVIERYRVADLIEARLATGRTHQIRVHFSAIGHPVLGDRTYGRKTSIRSDNIIIKIPRQMLHAQSLGIEHPVTKEWLEFIAPTPEDMKKVIWEVSSKR